MKGPVSKLLQVDFRKYYHTLRFLKFCQIRYQVWYRIRRMIRKKTGFSYPLSSGCQGNAVELLPFIGKSSFLKQGDCFTFLNRSLVFEGWNENREGKLWAYHLNYMDYLLQKDIALEEGKKWIDRFVEMSRKNREGMEPYPIALRGINWIKFFSIYREQISPEEQRRWDASLYAQYRILEDNLEYHLLGNHLLEDAFSLFWGGIYFQDEVFYHTAVDILRRELREQILPDGAHFELSPMYHGIMLDRLLDCINISKSNRRFEEQEEITRLMEEKAGCMLGWLSKIIYKNGDIPCLNDSNKGMSVAAEELFAYASRLRVKMQTVDMKESGYRKFVIGGWEWLVDVGQIGPDYQPGHAHADTFSFELYLEGRPVIVDTGVSTYEVNRIRFQERCSAAHNTVVINDRDSSRVWAGHRVAQRAKVTILEEREDFLSASHNGYRAEGELHVRSFKIRGQEIILEDQVNRLGKAYFHFAPQEQVRIESTQVNGKDFRILFDGAKEMKKINSWYSPEFNKRVENTCICVTFWERLTTTITRII